MAEDTSRAFVKFPVFLPAATMERFERQMKLDEIQPDPETHRMPFDKAIVSLLTAYADGRVVIVDTRHKHGGKQ